MYPIHGIGAAHTPQSGAIAWNTMGYSIGEPVERSGDVKGKEENYSGRSHA